MKKKYSYKIKMIDTQLIIAIAIMFVSIGALLISSKQATIMNRQTDLLLEQTHSGSWPYLDLQCELAGSESFMSSYKIVISNKGKGPAIIEGVKISFNGKASKDWFDLLSIANCPDTLMSIEYDNISHIVISDKEEIQLLGLSKNQALSNWFYQRADKIEIEICYKSVFNEYWVYKRKGFKTDTEQKELIRVESCSISEEEQFLQ